MADDDEKVRRAEAALVVWFRSSQAAWGWKLEGGGGCRALVGPITGAAWKPSRQTGGRAGRRARTLAVTLKSLVMWSVKVQQHFRQIPRLLAGPREGRLAATRQRRL